MLLLVLNVCGLLLILLGVYVVCMLKNRCTGFLFMGAGNVILCIFGLIVGNVFPIVLHGVIASICAVMSYNWYKDEKKIGK